MTFKVIIFHFPHKNLWSIHLDPDQWLDGSSREEVLKKAQVIINTW